MKVFSFILPLVLSLIPLSCDSFIHDSVCQAPAEIQEAIEALYPGARIVEVDREVNGYEVEIIFNRQEKDVTFDLDFRWIKTHTEDIRLSQLPQAVKTALAGSLYANWRIDDIDLFESPAASWYIIELERSHSEAVLRITSNGQILS